MTDTAQIGLTARYIGFGDLRWEEDGRFVEANNVHSLAAGAYLAFTF